MHAKWHRYKHSWGHEHVLFVGEWEWRVSAIPDDWLKDGMLEMTFGIKARWRATGPGLEGGRPTSPGSVLTKTLLQVKGRCEDAALRCLEACAKDLGMKVVPS